HTRPGLAPGRARDDRHHDREGHAHPGEGLDPRPARPVTDEASVPQARAKREFGPEPGAVHLEVRGLKVARGNKTIVRGVDLEARAGEVVGLLGPSGAGKSTFFRAAVGELPAEAGVVRILEGGALADASRWPLWRRARAGVGYVPQTPSVLWELSVR